MVLFKKLLQSLVGFQVYIIFLKYHKIIGKIPFFLLKKKWYILVRRNIINISHLYEAGFVFFFWFWGGYIGGLNLLPVTLYKAGYEDRSVKNMENYTILTTNNFQKFK